MDWLGELRGLLRHRQVNLDDLLRRIVDEATQRLGADRGTLYLVDHARNELVSRIAHLPEIAEIRLKMGEGVAGWVAKNGDVLNVVRDDPRFTRRIDEMTGYETRSLLAVPVLGSQGVIGVLQLLNKASGDFGVGDVEALSLLATDVGGLLETSGLRSQLQPGQRQPLSFRFNRIVGESPAMQDVYTRIERAARTEATVLLRGETGVGKELLARAIHDNSSRQAGPFVVVDCTAVPEALIENEMFGHTRGAFTGADRESEGRVAAAVGGTLFLDEVGELSGAFQAKLLRLVQERTYNKVGGNRPLDADVRFVCATHQNLEAMVAEGTFRQDLYYRMRVVEVEVPPLRNRGHADIDRLVDYFLYEFSDRHGRPGCQLTTRARQKLHAHGWPGNVRELEHCIEGAVVMAPGALIDADQLPLGRIDVVPAGPRWTTDADALRPLRDVEGDYIDHVLDVVNGNRSQAARILGIGRNTLARKLKD